MTLLASPQQLGQVITSSAGSVSFSVVVLHLVQWKSYSLFILSTWFCVGVLMIGNIAMSWYHNYSRKSRYNGQLKAPMDYLID